MANLQIRLDDQLKSEAQMIAEGMGLDLTTAVRMFLKQMVTDHGLPFRLSIDPFYNDHNQAL